MRMCVHESWWQEQLELRLGGGQEGGRNSGRAISFLFGHQLDFIFANPEQPQSLEVNMY
jgi:hypothetical protein